MTIKLCCGTYAPQDGLFCMLQPYLRSIGWRR